MKKVLRVIGIILLVILLLIAVFVGVFVLRDRILYSSFYANAKGAMPMPGIRDKYVPQGFCYLEDRQIYLSCGYMTDGTATRIYIFNDSGRCDSVTLKNPDGTDHTGHAGGISSFGSYVYLTAGTDILMFRLSDILDGDTSATAFDSFSAGLPAAYVHVQNGTLYVGEFYYPEAYETPESHRLTTPAGDQNTALLFGYRLNPETGKPEHEDPETVISTPGMVQGIAFDKDGRIILSTSYALHTSKLCVYDFSAMPGGTVELDGKAVEVSYLESSNLIRTVEAPPMSEEIVYRADTGRLLIMNESASRKYYFGILTSGRQVQSYDYDGTAD